MSKQHVEMARLFGFQEAVEAAAKIANKWAQTKPDLEKSDNHTTARAIASIIAEVAAKIEAEIRALEP